MRNLFARLFKSRSIASGAVMYIAMRWFDRLIGVVSTVILARLLTPDDLGIISLATVALGLAVMFFDFGINIAVVQRQDVDQQDIDTAWSLRLLQNGIVAVLLAVSAQLIADYYRDSRVGPVLIVLSCAYLLDGVTGMGPVIFQKRREYAREVAFFATKRAISFVVTIVLAVWLRSYWALVIGTLTASAIGVALSYAMHPVAPRFTLARWRTYLGASIWLSLRSMGGYAGRQIDKLIVGRREGAGILGAYSIADQISAMPGSELLQPTSRALFPAMAAKQDQPLELRRIFLGSLGVQTALVLPASVGLALVARDLVLVMLGERWVAAIAVMQALALAYGTNALTCSSGYLLASLAKYRAQAVLNWGIAALLAALVLMAFPLAGAAQIAWLRTGVCGVSVVAMTYLTVTYLPCVSVADMIKVIARPALATLGMAACVAWLATTIVSMPAWGRLLVEVSVGALVYATFLLGLWSLSGRPEGAERWMLERVRLLVRRPGGRS